MNRRGHFEIAATSSIFCERWYNTINRREFMETICIRTKLKKGSLDDVRKWFQTLRERPDEVLQSLKDEGVIVESAFLDKQDNDYYLIYYMKAENLSQARDLAMKSTLAIDKYHKECFKNFCEDRIELEQLIDFNRI